MTMFSAYVPILNLALARVSADPHWLDGGGGVFEPQIILETKGGL